MMRTDSEPGVAQGLTPAEAQEVVHLALGWDMSFLMTMALDFALFQTYAVVSGRCCPVRKGIG